jgi:rhomboid family GlyGly-CTERM serine protease
MAEPRCGLSRTRAHLPWAFVAAAVAAGLVASVPGANDWLIFDRAQIEAGQFWRLVTGHWAHFSTSHLFWNVVALAAAAMFTVETSQIRTGAFMAASALAIGVGVFCMEPDLRWFGGLSGVATALIARAVANRVKQEPTFRVLAVLGILLLAAKLIWEALTTQAVFAAFADADVRTSWIAHLLGLLVGSAFGLAEKSSRSVEPDAIGVRIRPCSRA